MDDYSMFETSKLLKTTRNVLLPKVYVNMKCSLRLLRIIDYYRWRLLLGEIKIRNVLRKIAMIVLKIRIFNKEWSLNWRTKLMMEALNHQIFLYAAETWSKWITRLKFGYDGECYVQREQVDESPEWLYRLCVRRIHQFLDIPQDVQEII